MLDVIICEDNEIYKIKIYKVVSEFLKRKSIKYNLYTFSEYNDKLRKYIMYPNENNKLYILDICLNNDDSGIEVANDIRKKEYDSIITIISGRTELIPEAQRLRLNILGYIYKQIDFENGIMEILESSIEIFNLRKSIKFSYNRNDYNIKLENILFIRTDKGLRKTIVETLDNTYEVSKPLIYFEDMVNNDFVKTSRSCIINSINVNMIDYEENVIKFCNGKVASGVISGKHINDIKDVVRND